jgi:two-component system, sensor histidine kinase and response regulator
MLLTRGKAGNEYVFDHPLRLLAVDDDPIMREFAATQLSQPGCEIVTAEDGEAAWAILEKDEAGFDLVLSDLEMPRINGFALVDMIRKDARFAHLPVVVITSREDMFAIDRAYEVGATSFVSKPVNWRLLGYQLRYVMRTSRMEAEVRVARDEARRAADLRESLLALLQHETRTPLHGIIGFAELLKGAGDPATLASHAGYVLDAARELNDKLRRIFYYSQASTGTLPLEMDEILLADFVEEASRAMRNRAAARGVAIDLRLSEEPLRVACDLRHLGAALEELLANAVAHSPAGARVTLELAREGSQALLRISDEGPGIAPEALARCFEPFGQAADAMTRSREGLGLGLPLARSLIERHGGRLTLHGAAPGLQARVALPLSASSAKDAGRSQAA